MATPPDVEAFLLVSCHVGRRGQGVDLFDVKFPCLAGEPTVFLVPRDHASSVVAIAR